jgi:hypothetical protein
VMYLTDIPAVCERNSPSASSHQAVSASRAWPPRCALVIPSLELHIDPSISLTLAQ